MLKALALAVSALLMVGCDNIATWSRSQAERDVEAQLGAPVRFAGVRYVRRTSENIVCGRADGRRFVWDGDYQEGGAEARFYTDAEAEAWRARCRPD